MKELYLVHVFGESESHFEGHYSEEEIKTIFMGGDIHVGLCIR